MRHVATAFSTITSKVVARVLFDFTLGRIEPIIVSPRDISRDSKCSQIEKFTDDGKSLVLQVASLFPCFFFLFFSFLLDVSSNFEHDVRLICVLTVYGRKVR